MTEDPAIRALFGPAPSDVDLTASEVSINNGVVIAMLCLAAAAVILRFTARIALRNALMADDWAIIMALICIGASTGLSVAGGGTGSGKHIWSVTLEELMHLYTVSLATSPRTRYNPAKPTSIQFLFSYTFVYASSCTCTRLSILLFYRRVFSPLEATLRAALIFGTFLTLSYPIIIWVTMGNACKPVTYFWTQFSGTQGECININQFFLAAGILNMLNDFIILVIPFPRIIKLQMTARKKLAICCIMAVGIFVCVASIVRIHYLSIFMGAVDVTWLMGPVFIWSTIEPSVAVVCACLPHLAPLARLVHRSILSSHQSENSGMISRGLRGESGKERSTANISGGRGPTFDYGFDKMKRDAYDDQIGLTNYVTAGPNEGKNPSVESFSEGLGRDHTIAVQSGLMQSTSPRPAW
ncbi:hypothetical protein N7489_004868 [Penicillium chrysogenum]|uniref:uncharacterized protein n=1 Tax=Penicillium chrysogenum TaxID=5076 RepID=UPI0024DF2368|nr:uncharacterized protein N7489_004868 [Penicillium chrysogenum]KAJ5244772.1 hypothetical protein N7489_004868 [Penicillium chrysogenum]